MTLLPNISNCEHASQGPAREYNPFWKVPVARASTDGVTIVSAPALLAARVGPVTALDAARCLPALHRWARREGGIDTPTRWRSLPASTLPLACRCGGRAFAMSKRERSCWSDLTADFHSLWGQYRAMQGRGLGRLQQKISQLLLILVSQTQASMDECLIAAPDFIDHLEGFRQKLRCRALHHVQHLGIYLVTEHEA